MFETNRPLSGTPADVTAENVKATETRYYLVGGEAMARRLQDRVRKMTSDKVTAGNDNVGGWFLGLSNKSGGPIPSGGSTSETAEAFWAESKASPDGKRSAYAPVKADLVTTMDVFTQAGLMKEDHSERKIIIVNNKVHPVNSDPNITTLEERLSEDEPGRRIGVEPGDWGWAELKTQMLDAPSASKGGRF